MQCSAARSPRGGRRGCPALLMLLSHMRCSVKPRLAWVALQSFTWCLLFVVFCVLAGLSVLQPQEAEIAVWNSVLVVQQQGAWWGLLRYRHLFLRTHSPWYFLLGNGRHQGERASS